MRVGEGVDGKAEIFLSPTVVAVVKSGKGYARQNAEIDFLVDR